MNLKEKMSDRKNVLILSCSVLGVVWLILLIQFLSPYISSWPDQAKIAKAELESVRLQGEYQKAKAAYDEMRRIRTTVRQMAADAWIENHDGTVDTVLRRRISEVVEQEDFKLNSLGTVRTGRINNDFSYAEIDLSGNGTLKDVIRFLAALKKIEPKLAWRRLDLRPDNRSRSGNAAGSANLALKSNTVPETKLFFNGCLRVLVYTGKMTSAELKIQRPAVGTVPADFEVKSEK